jgi:negative regulator of flagellin synthesis FlgM
MKIGPLDNNPAVAPTAKDRPTERKAPVDAGGTPGGAGVKVDLSAAVSALATDPGVDGTFDGAKVDRIAQAIRDGKFEVNADVIADKLIANAQELLGKKDA